MTAKTNTQYAAGYPQAMTDLLDAAGRGGVSLLAQWIADNCDFADRERALALLASTR
jgi:hypothetical protein